MGRVRLWAMGAVVAAAFAAGSAGAFAGAPAGAPDLPPEFKAYETPYYVIHTDHGVEMVREASVRLTCMAEAYHRRCKAFGGTIRKKFPFYLFKEARDYHGAGAPGGSAGCYVSRGMSGKLLARTDRQIGGRVWHVVQHEGFHQFVHMMIGGRIPISVNEGLAEYFGHGIWTGDDLVCGVIPPDRLKRVKALVAKGGMSPWREMFGLSHSQWGGMHRYDQAWSMVQFLVHGDGERYQSRFAAMIGEMAKRTPWDKAFVKCFGSDIDGLEARWREWWLDLPADPTRDLYDEATVATLTSFLARASMRDMSFETAEEFFAAGREGRLAPDAAEANEWNWLPASLLEGALKDAGKRGKWSLGGAPPGRPALVLERGDGTTFRGTYRLRSGSRPQVTVSVKPGAAGGEKKGS